MFSGVRGRGRKSVPSARAFGVLACSAALAVGVAACGDDSESGGGGGGGGNLPSEVKLGMLDTMSGVAAFCGEQERQGAELAVEEINSQKFLGDGVKLTIQVEDDKGTPEAGVAAFRNFVNDKVAAIVGPCLGTVAPATGPLAEQSKMPDIITTASGADVTPNYVFRAGIPQQEYAGNVIKVIKDQGHKDVAVMFDNAQPSIAQGSWGGAQKPAIEEEGLNLVEEEGVAGTNSDFGSQVSKVVAAKPDAVGVLFQGAPNLTIVKQLREAGFDGQIWGQQGMLNDFYIKGGPAVQDTMISVSYSPALPEGSTTKFTKDFEAKYNVTPSELSAHGYDAVWLAARGIKAAGSTDGEAVQKALAGIKEMEGAQGALTFTDTGDARGTGGVVKVNNGKLEGVELPGS
jgi:branched-chain amino acid transport system substrate-binding protein